MSEIPSVLKKRKLTMRRVFYEAHLWLGILSGLVVFVVCLSGAIYVFRPDVEMALEPEKYYITLEKDAVPMQVDELIAKIEQERKEDRVSSVAMFDNPKRTWVFSLASNQPMPPGENAGRPSSESPGGERSASGGPREGRAQGRGSQGGQRQGRGEGAPQREGGMQGQGKGGLRERSGDSQGMAGGPQQGEGRPQGGGPSGRGGQRIYVDPYTGKVCGEGNGPASTFFMNTMLLHRFLWLPVWIGRPVVGIATLIFIVTSVTGIALWIPVKWRDLKNWKKGFLIRFRKGGNCLLYDLHNTLGFYMLIPTLLLALTGLCWSFDWYRTAVNTVFGERVFAGREQRPVQIEPVDTENLGKPLLISELIAKTDALRLGRGDIAVSIPAPESNEALVVQKGGYGLWAFAIKDRYEWNPNTGESLKIERFQDRPFGSKAVTLVRSIHFGDILGLGSRIFFFIACLAATSFPVSGIWLWVNKLRRKWKRSKNIEQEETAKIS
jgi:Uncharacterized iron-regulated membrane protein